MCLKTRPTCNPYGKYLKDKEKLGRLRFWPDITGSGQQMSLMKSEITYLIKQGIRILKKSNLITDKYTMELLDLIKILQKCPKYKWQS